MFLDVFFSTFDPLRIIFAIDIYTFLESGHQGTTNEALKRQKAGFFLTEGKCNFSMAILVSKTCPNQKVA